MALGMKPSPEFGKILAKCFEAQLDGKFCTREDALEFLAKNIGRLRR